MTTRLRYLGVEPTGPIGSIRWIALFFCLANLALALPFVSAGATTERLGGAIAATALAACTVRAYHGGRFTPPGDAAAIVALMTLSYWLATPSRAIGLLFAFVMLRSLYGGSREVSAAALAAACGFMLTMQLAAGGDASRLVEAAAPAGLLVLAAPVLNRIWQRVRRFEERAERDGALAEVPLKLRSASGTQALAEIVQRAARRVTQSDAAVALVVEGDLVFWGSEAAALRLPLAELPRTFRVELAQGLPFVAGQVAVRGSVLVPQVDDSPPVLVAPICRHGGVGGLIAVSCPGGAPEWAETLAALASEASAALEATLAADAAAQREGRLHALLHNSPDLIATIDVRGTITYASPAIAPMLGYLPAGVVGSPFEALVDPDDADDWRALLSRLGRGSREMIEVRLRHRDGQARHAEVIASNLLEEGAVAAVILTVRDVSGRKASEDDLVHRAYHDPLTGLPNRRLFLERMRDVLARAGRRDSVAVLFVDLDGFKAVNDRYSHAAGDALLQQVAARLQVSLRPTDTAARLSGDEFAILLGDLHEGAEAGRVARRMLDALVQPCQVDQRVLRIGASIGVAVGGAGAEDANDLLHRADLAMYAAKSRGGDMIEIRLPDDHQHPDRRAQLAAELPEAVRSGQLEVRYQPVVSLSDEHIVAAEALVRWQHPTWGLLAPEAFIPLAENAGLITDVFNAVLARACEHFAAWSAASQVVPVSVNLSPLQLRQADLAARVAGALAAANLPADRLILEVPQRALIEDPVRAEQVLGDLKMLGVGLAIDGFSAEHPSIPFLRRLNVDAVKLDPLLLADPSDDGALARPLVELAAGIGLPAIATGVEGSRQRDSLRAVGCAYAQGHLFSRAVSDRSIAALLQARTVVYASDLGEADAAWLPPVPQGALA